MKIMKLTISRKLLLGYLVMALLTVMASAYAVVSLRQLNDLAYGIINQDFFIVENSKKMMDTLLAQESAERKYLILKDPSLAEIFRARNREFVQSLQELAAHPFPGFAKLHPQIASLAQQYGALFEQELALVGENRSQEAMTLSEGDGKKNHREPGGPGEGHSTKSRERHRRQDEPDPHTGGQCRTGHHCPVGIESCCGIFTGLTDYL